MHTSGTTIIRGCAIPRRYVYLVHFILWFGVIKHISLSEFTLFTIEGPSRIGSSKASLQPRVVSALFVETNEAILLRLQLSAQVASSRGEEKLGPLSGLSSQEIGTIILVQPSRLRGHQISFNILIMGADINLILRGGLGLRWSFKDLRITRTHSLSNYIAFRSSTLRTLSLFNPIGVWRSSVNYETVFLVYRSCLTIILLLTYHVDWEAFLA